MRPAYHGTPDHPTCQTHPLVPAYEASFNSLSLPIWLLVKDAISFRGERHWGPRDGRGGADGRWVDRRGRRYRQRNPRPQKRSTRTSTNLGRQETRVSVSLNANSCETRFFPHPILMRNWQMDISEFNVNVMTPNNGVHQHSPRDPGIQKWAFFLFQFLLQWNCHLQAI